MEKTEGDKLGYSTTGERYELFLSTTDSYPHTHTYTQMWQTRSDMLYKVTKKSHVHTKASVMLGN